MIAEKSKTESCKMTKLDTPDVPVKDFLQNRFICYKAMYKPVENLSIFNFAHKNQANTQNYLVKNQNICYNKLNPLAEAFKSGQL